MNRYGSDEFLSYQFDEPFVYNFSQHKQRDADKYEYHRHKETNNNNSTDVTRNAVDKPDYGLDEDDGEIDASRASSGDSSSDDAADEDYADDVYSEGRRSFTNGDGNSSTFYNAPPQTSGRPEESKIMLIRTVRRHGYFKCRKCKYTWESSYVFCKYDGMKNDEAVYKPTRGMSCTVCDTRNYPNRLRAPGRQKRKNGKRSIPAK